MVNDMTGQFFFQARGHVALIKSAWPKTERESMKGWWSQLTGDVTHHRIYDQSIISLDVVTV